MTVFFTGGTGYIGGHLVRALLARGTPCVVVTRSAADPWRDPRVRLLRADPREPGDWQEVLDGCAAVVNLAGAPLVDPPHRWTGSRKRTIQDSRVETTANVAAAIARARRPPAVFLSGSAVGYYGDRGDDVLTERTAPGTDFLAGVCNAWEAAAVVPDSTREVRLRTGLVLGHGSPLLAPMVPVFKMGVGGAWGSGTQWWPWVHIADVVGIVLYLLDEPVTGPVNVTAPEPVRVSEFAERLAAALHRPAVARVPAFALRLALGEMADALLASQRVEPATMRGLGYAFRFPTLPPALDDIFGRRSGPKQRRTGSGG